MWRTILLLLVGASAVHAESVEVLKLPALVEEAKQNNPAIQAVRSRAAAAALRPAQVSRLDDPMLSWESWNAPESLRLDRADNNILSISQSIPFPGKRR